MNKFNHNESDFSFLILIDFSDASYKALNYLIKLAKNIGGGIELFHMIDSRKMDISNNQIATLREIQLEEQKIQRKLSSILEMIELENIKATYSYVFGNPEVELKLKLAKSSQIIVIGKNENGQFSKTANFLIDHNKGNLLIVNTDKDFMEGSIMVIGCDKESLMLCDLHLQTNLVTIEEEKLSLNDKSPNKKTTYAFPTIKKKELVSYVNNSKVESIFICRDNSSESRFNNF